MNRSTVDLDEIDLNHDALSLRTWRAMELTPESLQLPKPNAYALSTLRNTTGKLQDADESGIRRGRDGVAARLQTGYFPRRLYKQRYVCMFGRGRAPDKGKITLEEYSTAEHLIVIRRESGHAKMNEAIERKGIRRKIRLTVPHYVAVGHILATDTNNMVAAVPES